MGGFEEAIVRMPRWILLLAAAGTAVSGTFLGVPVAGGFLLGSIAAYVNFRMIERAVNRAARLSMEPGVKPPGKGTGVWVLIQFSALIFGAFVILKSSGFSLTAAFCGFFVCPAAALIEIVYELVTYDHS